MKHQRNLYFLLIMVLLSLFLVYNYADAKITGNCVNCHTIHNSQNGQAMATYGAAGQPWKGAGPFKLLVRGNCLGCHGMGTANKIVTIGGSDIPQVYHIDASGDLAGGNFAYITGAKSRITADQNSAGHNVIDLGSGYQESVLTVPPGFLHGGESGVVSSTNLTCEGRYGCHGYRIAEGSGVPPMVKGAHHKNLDGKCNTDPASAEVYNSYRFLLGVKGLENTGTYKWQNYNTSSHNEYFGATSPLDNHEDCNTCHLALPPPRVDTIYSSSGTISAFCGTCHTNFHALGNSCGGCHEGSLGIGGDTVSPFTRHPTDVILPVSGEYSAYTNYSVEAPVARGAVPDNISSTVTPGDSGTEGAIVMCLSCHAAHATPYEDILKWDYSTMVAGGGGSGGCFTCHTQKNQSP
jgi:hypothetical protein